MSGSEWCRPLGGDTSKDILSWKWQKYYFILSCNKSKVHVTNSRVTTKRIAKLCIKQHNVKIVEERKHSNF